MMNKVYILGGAQTDFSRNWKKEGKGLVALLKESVFDGLAAADITVKDIETYKGRNKIQCFNINHYSPPKNDICCCDSKILRSAISA